MEASGMSKVRISTVNLLYERILPFFSQYSLVGFKLRQFNIWVKAVHVVNQCPVYTLEREIKLTSILNELSSLQSSKF